MVDQNLLTFLTKLSLSPEAARVYLYLLKKPAQSAQAIAEATHIPKTTVYRRIDELKLSSLVEERVEENARLFTAAPADLLELLVIKREQGIADLRAQLPGIAQFVGDQQTSFDPETKVLYYRGKSGIQQMLWNNLRAKNEIVGYTYLDLTPFVGEKFYGRWHDECMQRRIGGRDIISDAYIVSKFRASDPAALGWEDWDSHYVSPEILTIRHQIDIYNDVVGIYNWVGSDVFGIEIYNRKVAALQRQLFELVWEKGQTCSFDEQATRYRELTSKQ
ncbi:MAG TPA: helix-turn-helix domain-containing protein [Candidatus Saccharimonadales bacterium]|nr:helix-turn-helix domain-containing protein [Candidatus Saccharimonadales bacterium]